MAVGLDADTDWLNRTTNIGSVGIAGITLAGWHYRVSAGQVYGDVADSGICSVVHSSNGRHIAVGFDGTGSTLITEPRLSVFDHLTTTQFPGGDDHPTFDTWVFYILRSGAAGGTLTAEWSELGSATWHTQTMTNGVEGSVQGEVVQLGRQDFGVANTSRGRYAYWHAYTSEIGQAASRALKTATTAQNSPWAFWPLDDNTDTADDSGNARTLTFNGTITSETSPVFARQFFLIHP